ncbi:Had-like domain, partial [Globisporangium polare]
MHSGWKWWKRAMSTNTPAYPLLGRRIVLCADFDQTLTVKDTIALLTQCATARKRSTHARANHEAHVQRVVAQYASEMNAFLAEFHKSSVRSSTTANAPPA